MNEVLLTKQSVSASLLAEEILIDLSSTGSFENILFEKLDFSRSNEESSA